MTAEEVGLRASVPSTAAPDGPDWFDTAIRDLLTELTLRPWGQTSPSVYETGRLVSLAPWLTGHAKRVAYLIDQQRADGGWGGPEGYALVPTLSATEALLSLLPDEGRAGPDEGRPGAAATEPGRLAAAAERGLGLLFQLLDDPTLAIPDTPAVDLIVPALTADINARLDRIRTSPLPGPVPAGPVRPLPLPPGMNEHRLTAIRRALASGTPVPEKLSHALEVVGELARRASGVVPVPPGTVGGSPAATAAWLGGPDADATAGNALAYLETVAGWHGGPAPCATPITVFERAWVLSTLVRTGRKLVVPPALLESLRSALGPTGTPAGPGLPADADTTSVALHALSRLGRPAAPTSLWSFDTGSHFCTWPGEDGASITTNAHVLDAFGHHLVNHPDATRYQAAVERLTAWLVAQQDADGAWRDRWHASPYYATVCAALALGEFGRGPAAGPAVARSLDWIIATQRGDGSWGRWGGTVEETAYALQTLLVTGAAGHSGLDAAAARGLAFLGTAAEHAGEPLLWHDKDLYRPGAIVRAAVIAARELGRQRRDLPHHPEWAIPS